MKIRSDILLMLVVLISAAIMCRSSFAQQIIHEEWSLIFIKSDGSVYPSSASIKRDGHVYTFVGDVFSFTLMVELTTSWWMGQAEPFKDLLGAYTWRAGVT